MNIKRNIIFSPESRKKEGKPITDNAPIRMRVVYGGKRVDFSTGYRIDISKWDSSKQRVKNGCTNKLKQSATEINADLSLYETDIQNIFKEFEIQELIPSTEELRLKFNHKRQGISSEKTEEIIASKQSFMTLFDKFVKESGSQNNWSDSTYDKFATAKNHLQSFDPKLSFDTLTETKLTAYLSHLREKKNMRNSSVEKQLGFLKWFLRWTLKNGYNTNSTFMEFKPKLKTTQKKVIFLTWEELTQLREYEIPEQKKYLDRVRDVFLFLCYTGLRYSDVFNLKRSDIKTDHIEVTTVKTADSLVIELNDYSRAILEKYQDIPFEKHKVLPVITNQKMNDYLKELAELAQIDEPIRETYYKGNERIDEITPKYALLGTHAGRRTFICNSLSMGIPAQTVMKWTGHSDYKAMKPYIDVADKAKQEAMALWNKKEEQNMNDLVEKMKTLSKEELSLLLDQIK